MRFKIKRIWWGVRSFVRNAPEIIFEMIGGNKWRH